VESPLAAGCALDDPEARQPAHLATARTLWADVPAEFTIPVVPLRRFVAEATSSGWRSVNSLHGGVAEELGSRFEQNLLGDWLTNDAYPVRMYPKTCSAVDSVTLFRPAR
jgi:hypothetical protein